MGLFSLHDLRLGKLETRLCGIKILKIPIVDLVLASLWHRGEAFWNTGAGNWLLLSLTGNFLVLF